MGSKGERGRKMIVCQCLSCLFLVWYAGAAYHLRPHYSSEHIDPKSKQKKNIFSEESVDPSGIKSKHLKAVILYCAATISVLRYGKLLSYFMKVWKNNYNSILKSVTLVILLSHLKPKDHYNLGSLAKKESKNSMDTQMLWVLVSCFCVQPSARWWSRPASLE